VFCSRNLPCTSSLRVEEFGSAGCGFGFAAAYLLLVLIPPVREEIKSLRELFGHLRHCITR